MIAAAAAALLNLLGYITGLSLYTMLLVMLLKAPRAASALGRIPTKPTVCRFSPRCWGWHGIWARCWTSDYTISADGVHRRWSGRRPSSRSDFFQR